MDLLILNSLRTNVVTTRKTNLQVNNNASRRRVMDLQSRVANAMLHADHADTPKTQSEMSIALLAPATHHQSKLSSQMVPVDVLKEQNPLNQAEDASVALLK